MDKFYSSVPLFKDLSRQGTGATGTVRANRKDLQLLPKTFGVGVLEKDKYKTAQWNYLAFCIWQDTKRVCVLSNQHDPKDTGTVNRWTGQPQQRAVVVPKLLADYQKNMKGVDLCDQMIGYYMIRHRSKKWWRRVFFYLMMASAHNALVLTRKEHPLSSKRQWPGFKEFLMDLVIDLKAGIRVNRAQPAMHILTLSNRESTPRYTLKRRTSLYKVCRECQVRGETRRRTLHYCKECNVSVHEKCWAYYSCMD